MKKNCNLTIMHILSTLTFKRVFLSINWHDQIFNWTYIQCDRACPILVRVDRLTISSMVTIATIMATTFAQHWSIDNPHKYIYQLDPLTYTHIIYYYLSCSYCSFYTVRKSTYLAISSNEYFIMFRVIIGCLSIFKQRMFTLLSPPFLCATWSALYRNIFLHKKFNQVWYTWKLKKINEKKNCNLTIMNNLSALWHLSEFRWASVEIIKYSTELTYSVTVHVQSS